MDTLVSIRVFCAVAELKSFASAASRLGLSTAMTSKHVMHLENRLQTRLLNRTSRHVSLTESGALYFEQTRQMLDALQETEEAVSKTAVTPRGTLKLSAPVWMANTIFAEILSQHREQYPEVRLDIDLSGRLVNLVEEGFDVALRMTQGALDPSLVARRLSEVHFHLVASPEFLKRNGRPQSLADLEGRPFLAYSFVSADGTITLESPDGPRVVHLDPVMKSSNETILRMAAIHGMGLTFVPEILIEQELADGRLDAVLPGTARGVGTLYIVYPSRKYLSAKVRTFVDFCVSQSRLKRIQSENAAEFVRSLASQT